ncbi:MAG: hypothetical protein ACYC6H_06715 [Bellilinea sp.]
MNEQAKGLLNSFEIERERLAAIGNLYPPEFVNALASTAYSTAWDWMKANNIPENIISLLDQAIMLTRAAGMAAAGTLETPTAAELPEQIGMAVNLIAEMEGSFYTADSIIPAKPRKVAAIAA